MIARIVYGLLLVVIACSGKQQRPKSGLLIENGINRGSDFSDSLGNNFNHRYIPISITNDSTIPIHIRIAFSKEYYYPIPDSLDKFSLVPLPEAWALEGVGITESMTQDLPSIIEQPVLEKSLEPGEKFMLGIGTLYPRPPRSIGILPNELFAHIDRGSWPNCDWLMKDDPSSNPPITLGLKLKYGKRCMIIACGQISYPES